jgi:hypothetical protein
MLFNRIKRNNLFKISFLFILFLASNLFVFSQEDTLSKSELDSLPYELYKQKVILYSDFGYTSAPFSIKYNFPGSLDKLKFRNNYQEVLGFGISYKWFTLRLFHTLKDNTKSEDNFGKTNYRGVGFVFNLKKTFWDVDLRSFTGYAIKDAYNWNDTLSKQTIPNDIRANTNSYSFSINTWYFNNKHFKMQAVLGKKGRFTQPVHSWYLKGSFNVYGINNGKSSIIPLEIVDPKNSKTKSNTYSAVDIGVIPGYAYATNIKNWQFSSMFGFGAVIQNKIYNVNGLPRSNLGLAPRYDIRFIFGYTVPKYFIFLVSDFDNKSIRFNDLIYRQSFYSIKILGGIRLTTREEKRKKE